MTSATTHHTTDAATGEAILAAILAEPECDTHRLVYADWLEENGEELRAQYLRTGEPIDPPSGLNEPAWDARLLGLSVEASEALGALSEIEMGLVREVTLSEANWLAHGPEIASRHPLVRVTLVEKEPFADGNSWCAVAVHQQGHTFHVAPELLPMSKTAQRRKKTPNWSAKYVTAEDALAALSARCITWAREEWKRHSSLQATAE